MRRYSPECARLCELLHCSHPFLLAPMAGGSGTTALAVAVASTGAVGAVPGAYLSAKSFKEHLREARMQTRKNAKTAHTITGTNDSLVANLFIPHTTALSVDWSHPSNRMWLQLAVAEAEEWAARGTAFVSATTQTVYADIDVGHNATVAFMRTANVSAHRRAAASAAALDDPLCVKPASHLSMPSPDRLVESQRRAVYEFERSVVAVIEEGMRGLSFVFGIPDDAIIKEIKSKKMAVIGTATSVEEAEHLRDAGFDVIVAQGIEAGGHRGSFVPPLPIGSDGVFCPDVADSSHLYINPADDSTALRTCELVRRVREQFQRCLNASNAGAASRLPLVVAAGGLTDADSIASAFLHGAAGVQVGTAFLLTKEAGTSDVVARAIRQWSASRPTVFTLAFSGRWARGIRNATVDHFRIHSPSKTPDEMLKPPKTAADEAAHEAMVSMNQQEDRNTTIDANRVLPFPLQNELINNVKRRVITVAEAAAAQDSQIARQARLAAGEFTNLWAGENVISALQYDRQPAAKVAMSLITQVDDMLMPTVNTHTHIS